MSRYIDADKLIEDGWHLERHGTSGALLQVMSLADVPTVDIPIENKKKYFTPEEVRQMPPEKIRKNYDDIFESMSKW